MLVIDTCGAQGSVAVAALEGDPRVLAERTLPGRETQERLMTALEEVLAEAGISAQDLAAIGVGAGPGSFTGVRIGLAAAKGLAESLTKPLVAVSRLAVLASLAPGKYARAWIDAGRGDVFVGRYRDGVRVSEAMQTSEGAGASMGQDETVVFFEDRFSGAGDLRVAALDAAAALPLLAKKLLGGELADTALLDANYLRVPDAELALQGLR